MREGIFGRNYLVILAECLYLRRLTWSIGARAIGLGDRL